MSNSCRLPHITSQTFESAKQMTFSSLAAWQTDCFSLLTLHPNHAHCILPITHCPLPIAHCPFLIAYCPLPMHIALFPLAIASIWAMEFSAMYTISERICSICTFWLILLWNLHNISTIGRLLDVQLLFNLILASWHN